MRWFVREPSTWWILCCGADQPRRHDDLNQTGGHIIDKAGYKPRAWQCRNRPEQGNVKGNRRTRIGDLFFSPDPFPGFENNG